MAWGGFRKKEREDATSKIRESRKVKSAFGSNRDEEVSMHLTPREFDKLILYMMADVAEKRRAKNLKLNYPEAVSVIFCRGSRRSLRGARRLNASRWIARTPLLSQPVQGTGLVCGAIQLRRRQDLSTVVSCPRRVLYRMRCRGIPTRSSSTWSSRTNQRINPGLVIAPASIGKGGRG